MSAIELLNQNPLEAESHLYEILNRHLRSSDLRAVRVVMAYVTWGGLSLVADAMEAFLKRKGHVSTIFGVGNGVTTPDALCYAHYLQSKFSTYSDSFGIQWDYSDSVFHPKFVEFDYPDRKAILVGSANLTNGGMAANHEIALAVTVPREDSLSATVESIWRSYLDLAEKVEPLFIRELSKKKSLGQEGEKRGSRGEQIGLSLKRAKKPLFAHILDGDSPPHFKHGRLSETSTLSEKPSQLYLQILGETGGGHQVQLPVATLAAFFGVGEGEVREVTFKFSGDDEVQVQLTHFGNNTHRVRLRPIKSLPRPSILVFERSDDDGYRVRVVSHTQYASVLRTRCTEQTRAGSRRWGLR